jgi:hypothetical protein
MNQNFNHDKIRQLLNRSLGQIESPTLERLRDARTQALARYDARHSTAPALAWAGHSAHARHGANSHHRPYYWAAAILLAACLFSGASYWRHASEHEISEVDVAILTDDLPIHVYVD